MEGRLDINTKSMLNLLKLTIYFGCVTKHNPYQEIYTVIFMGKGW